MRTATIDDRAVTPAVSKSLEATVVVLFIGLVTVTLYGGVVPGYRTTAGDEVADRTLAAAAHRVQAAVPPDAKEVSARVRVDIPKTIRGEGYRIRAEGRTLVLVHSHRGVGGRTRLTLPPGVVSVDGEWYSRRDRPVVVVTDVPGGLAVELRHAGSESGGSPSISSPAPAPPRRGGDRP